MRPDPIFQEIFEGEEGEKAMTFFKGQELDLSWENWRRNCRVVMKVSEWELKGIRAEQVGPGLPGTGCENFPTSLFCSSLHWVVWKPSWNSKCHTTWVTPVKDTGNLKSSDSHQKLEFQLFSMF